MMTAYCENMANVIRQGDIEEHQRAVEHISKGNFTRDILGLCITSVEHSTVGFIF